MSAAINQGSTPAAVPVESGGASTAAHLQWVQQALNAHSSRLDSFSRSLADVTSELKAITAESAERSERLAVIKSDVSHARDNIAEIKGAQITEAALLRLENEIVKSMNAMQTALTAQIVLAKEAAANDLRQHEERARASRRWVVGVLIPTAIGVAGLVARMLFF